MEKKIATSIDVLINVAQYEHIQITKYAETKIVYDSPEDMVKQEDKLTDELQNDLLRTLKSLHAKLGKKVAVIENLDNIQDKMRKKIPEWLENSPEPNIANTAVVNADKSIAKEHAQEVVKTEQTAKFKEEASKETDSFLNDTSVAEKKDEDKSDDLDLGDADLFSDDDLFKT